MNSVLEICVDIERRVGAIYRELVRHPEANNELREIWQEMAEDEARHAERIQLVADRLDVAGMTDVGLTAEQAQALLDRAAEIYDDVVEGRLSISDAVYASVELEDEFMKAHLNYSDTGGQPDLQTLFKFLAEEDRQHTVRLKKYLNRMNDGKGLVFEDPA
ncbi:MAG: hypothetical protein KAT93_01035 [Desulfuromonadales bacterium]|nr:hypothetical protein [Desulfuromonadales bacterium]